MHSAWIRARTRSLTSASPAPDLAKLPLDKLRAEWKGLGLWIETVPRIIYMQNLETHLFLPLFTPPGCQANSNVKASEAIMGLS